MRFGVVTFPGSNCDYDALMVVRDQLGESADFVWHKDTSLRDFDCIILPGGFSYGDYLRTGAIARFSPVMEAVKNFAAAGGLVIGICNGFQVLLEAGLLPGAMLRNAHLRFACKHVYICCENSNTPFSNQIVEGEIMKVPIAHSDGNYYAYEGDIAELERHRQIVFRYCSSTGEINGSANPNGSTANIAGICNREQNVLGMMPHPERASEKLLGSADGLKIFQSIRAAISERVTV